MIRERFDATTRTKRRLLLAVSVVVVGALMFLLVRWRITQPSLSTVALQPLAAPEVGTSPTTSPALWVQQSPAFPRVPVTAGISCPTAMTCYAAGWDGTIAVSADAGASWQSRGRIALRADMHLTNLSCPTVERCLATGKGNNPYQNVYARTIDAGQTWMVSVSASIGSYDDITSVACPDATTCYATVSYGVQLSNDGGVTWHVMDPPSTALLQSISCGTPRQCIAVGGVQGPDGSIQSAWRTTDGGTTWNDLIPTLKMIPNAVSCPTSLTCLIAGTRGDLRRTTDGGNQWQALSLGTKSFFDEIKALHCVNELICLAVSRDDEQVHRTTDGGHTWSVQAMPGRFILGFVCPQPSRCLAWGSADVFLISTDAGEQWQVEPAAPTVRLRTIRCPARDTCYTVGEHGTLLATNDAGQHWRSQTISTQDLVDVACPGVTTCLVLTDDDRINTPNSIVITQDGGQHWSTTNIKDDAKQIVCSTLQTCAVLVPNGLLMTTDGGATWTATQFAKQFHSLSGAALHCWTDKTCIVVGWDSDTLRAPVARTTDGGQTWSQQAVGDRVSLTAVSCPTTLHCVAIARDGVVVITDDGGVHWAVQPTPAVDQLTAIMCPTATQCYAPQGISRDGGTTWITPAGWQVPANALDCPAVDMCYAVGESGRIWASTGVPTQP